MSDIYIPDKGFEPMREEKKSKVLAYGGFTPKKYVEVTAGRLNIRANPSYHSLVLCVVGHGETLEIRTNEMETNGFIPISTKSGITGWAAKKFVE